MSIARSLAVVISGNQMLYQFGPDAPIVKAIGPWGRDEEGMNARIGAIKALELARLDEEILLVTAQIEEVYSIDRPAGPSFGWGHSLTSLASSSVTSLTFTYDGMGRLETATDSRLGGKTVSYMYDEVGRRAVDQAAARRHEKAAGEAGGGCDDAGADREQEVGLETEPPVAVAHPQGIEADDGKG